MEKYFSLSEPEGLVKENGSEPDNAQKHISSEETQLGKPVTSGGTITAALSHAGNVLEGAEAELVLNPLRLAFGTKNLKLQEPALDCLHVRIYFGGSLVHFISFQLLYSSNPRNLSYQ